MFKETGIASGCLGDWTQDMRLGPSHMNFVWQGLSKLLQHPLTDCRKDLMRSGTNHKRRATSLAGCTAVFRCRSSFPQRWHCLALLAQGSSWESPQAKKCTVHVPKRKQLTCTAKWENENSTGKLPRETDEAPGISSQAQQEKKKGGGGEALTCSFEVRFEVKTNNPQLKQMLFKKKHLKKAP